MTATGPFCLAMAFLSAPAAEQVEITTRDGARLRGKRYPGSGVPVVLLHGLAANLNQFDLSTKESPSLSHHLHALGYDVWLMNFRGAGQKDLESLLPRGRTGWCADDYIVEDLPAILRHVRRDTGRRPFLVGHSLGGMTVAAFLSGAVLKDPSRPGAGVIIDAARSRERNRMVRGAVLLSAPARLAWSPGKAPKTLVTLARYGDRLFAEKLLPPRLRFSRLNNVHSDDAPAFVRRLVEGAEGFLSRQLAESGLLSLAFGKNRERALRLLKKFRGGVLSDCSRDVLVQLGRGVERQTWQSFLGPEGARIRYPEHYGRISTPVLVMVGDEDSIADPAILRRDLLEKLGSTDRTMITVPDYGHTDVTLGENTSRDVFPLISRWLERRSTD